MCEGKIVYFFDDKMQTTYYLARADMRITVVVLFQGKKNERDSYVVTFLQGKLDLGVIGNVRYLGAPDWPIKKRNYATNYILTNVN